MRASAPVSRSGAVDRRWHHSAARPTETSATTTASWSRPHRLRPAGRTSAGGAGRAHRSLPAANRRSLDPRATVSLAPPRRSSLAPPRRRSLAPRALHSLAPASSTLAGPAQTQLAGLQEILFGRAGEPQLAAAHPAPTAGPDHALGAAGRVGANVVVSTPPPRVRSPPPRIGSTSQRDSTARDCCGADAANGDLPRAVQTTWVRVPPEDARLAHGSLAQRLGDLHGMGERSRLPRECERWDPPSETAGAARRPRRRRPLPRSWCGRPAGWPAAPCASGPAAQVAGDAFAALAAHPVPGRDRDRRRARPGAGGNRAGRPGTPKPARST